MLCMSATTTNAVRQCVYGKCVAVTKSMTFLASNYASSLAAPRSRPLRCLEVSWQLFQDRGNSQKTAGYRYGR